MSTKDKGFILHLAAWDVPRDEKGGINTSGAIGVVSRNNVYLLAYAQGGPTLQDDLDRLEVGQAVRGVKFFLNDESGIYNIWRVR